mgnify:FL=1
MVCKCVSSEHDYTLDDDDDEGGMSGQLANACSSSSTARGCGDHIVPLWATSSKQAEANLVLERTHASEIVFTRSRLFQKHPPPSIA